MHRPAVDLLAAPLRLCAVAAWSVLMLWSAPARAELVYNGYLSERLQVTLPNETALISTQNLAILQSLSEANIQVKFKGLDDKLLLYSDTSAFASVAGGYADRELSSGHLKLLSEHDVPSYRPLFVISEAYGSYEVFEHMVVLAGKKRVVWGTALSFNPSDVINPPRDPTDPNFQRAGAYVAKVDFPFEKFTLTGLASPKPLYTQAGIPYSFFMYPGYAPAENVANPTVVKDPRDNLMHYALAARAYMLVLDTDINIWGVFTNLYNDDLENKPRLAASFSRYLSLPEVLLGAIPGKAGAAVRRFSDNLKGFEVHGEALGQLGNNQSYVNKDCVLSDAAIAGCVVRGTTLAEQSEKNSSTPYARFLVGSRAQLWENSVIGIEYMYQGDGYSSSEFRDQMRVQRRIGTLLRKGTAGAGASSGASGGGDLPVRFSFDPLRRHYLILTYQKPMIMDDWTVTATSITSIEDLSSTVSGSVTWNAREWLNLGMFVFLPLPSPSRVSYLTPWDPMGEASVRLGERWNALLPMGAEVDGERYGENDAQLFRGRVTAEARVFF